MPVLESSTRWRNGAGLEASDSCTLRANIPAVDEGGRNPYAVIPGGARQRTVAYRFGVNLVMYALTGNYKGDQVHVPAILQRLGQ